MSKFYEVTVTITEPHTVVVEARNEEDAYEQVMEMSPKRIRRESNLADLEFRNGVSYAEVEYIDTKIAEEDWEV